MTALTQDLGKFIAGLRFDMIPEGALPAVRTGFADCVGVMLAGRTEPAVQILLEALAPAPGTSRLLLGSGTAGARDAALINGTAAHALDFDDVTSPLRGHVSTVLVPAILAEGEAVGASGKAMVTAYVAGFETWAELVRREPDQHHGKGWHPTAIFGAIGAAAACASLLRLDAQQASHAVALSASLSAGVMSNFGSMTKPFHAGRAAQSGALAARLAAGGFTASHDALEHSQGFLSAVSPAGRVDRESRTEAGTSWKLVQHGISVKKYPLCYCTHRALDGILDLLQEQPISPADIERVRVSTSRRNATILRNHRPRTGLEAKFSMEFAMASAIVAGRASLVELTDPFVQRDDVQSLLSKVLVDLDDREDPVSSGYAPYDRVTIETRDGRQLQSRDVAVIRGSSTSPLTRDELWAKFEACAAVSGTPSNPRPLFDALMSIEKVADVRALPIMAMPGR